MASNKLTFTNSHSAVQVKVGFCWPAFFLGGLWAAAKRMWFPYFLAMLIVDIAMWFLLGYAEASENFALMLLGMIGTIVYAVVRGRRGNQWHASSLLSRGYKQS